MYIYIYYIYIYIFISVNEYIYIYIYISKLFLYNSFFFTKVKVTFIKSPTAHKKQYCNVISNYLFIDMHQIHETVYIKK